MILLVFQFSKHIHTRKECDVCCYQMAYLYVSKSNHTYNKNRKTNSCIINNISHRTVENMLLIYTKKYTYTCTHLCIILICLWCGEFYSTIDDRFEPFNLAIFNISMCMCLKIYTLYPKSRALHGFLNCVESHFVCSVFWLDTGIPIELFCILANERKYVYDKKHILIY
jgi:hypothetical protein